EDTQVIPAYPRPQGATPLRASLVIAYAPCTSPNRQHAPPLAVGSCAPPQQRSSELTVGTLDANGNAANSIGSVRFDVAGGDVREALSITDVRRKGDLSDSTGELQENA